MLADTPMERVENGGCVRTANPATRSALRRSQAATIAPDSSRLQRDANLSQLHSHGSSARYRAAVFRLSGGCSAIELRRMVGKWSRAPVLPRVPPRSKRGGFADSLARDVLKLVAEAGFEPAIRGV